MKLTSENKRFYKTLIYLALPIILQDFLNAFVNVLDVFMIGSLGDETIAAVGLANQIFFLFSLMLFGINSGASIFMGQFWGKGDVKSIHKTMGISLVLSFITSVLFTLPAFFIPEKLMAIYSFDSEVIVIGSSYLRIVCISYIVNAFTVTLNFSLKSTGQTRIPMVTTFCAVVLNALFNYLFIFVLNQDVKGAAIATLIARCAELIIQLLICFKYKVPVIGKAENYININAKFFKSFLVITVPVILNEVIWSFGTSMYNIAYKQCGTYAQSAVQIASTAQNLFGVIGMGIGSACAIMLSNTLGAGENKLAINYSRKFMVISVLISLFMGAMLFIFSPLYIGLFDVSDIVKDYTLKIIIVIAIGTVFKSFNYTTIVGILRSGGDTTFCLILDLLSVWFVGLPLAFLGAMYFKVPIYFVVALVYFEEVVKLIVSGIRVKTNIWAKSLVE